MYYRLDDIIAQLKKNKSVILPDMLPRCPKHNNTECKKNTGRCLVGNAQKCEQRFQFDTENGLFILYPIFVYPAGSKHGFIKKYNSTLERLFRRGIIDEQVLTAVP